MKQYQFHDFMRLPFFFYHTIGIEPYTRSDRDSRLNLASLFNFYLGVINLTMVLLGEIMYVLVSFKNNENFVEATMTCSYIGFINVAEIKMLTIWMKKTKLTKFIREMETIFPQNIPDQKKYNLSYYLKRCQVITTSFATLYMLLIWTYNLMAIIQYFVYKYVLHNPETEKLIPYNVLLPWDWQHNWTYYIIYAVEVYAGYTSATGILASDLLLYCLTTQMIMHFNYVARSLEFYQVQGLKFKHVNKQGVQKDMQFLQNMIVYHEKLLKLSDQMNEIFGIPLLLNFMTSSCVICFVGFQMTLGARPEMFFKLGLFLFSSMTQVYLICYFSQQLNDASFGVSMAVYNQNWYDGDLHYQKMLILIANRAQKHVSLQATILLPIFQNTMTEIMQMSYKFFALLRTMYSQ